MPLSSQQMEDEENFYRKVRGWCLKQRRLAQHLSQTELAERAHVSRGQIQHAEHGRHGQRDGTKFRHCTGLGISVMELESETLRVMEDWRRHGPPPDADDDQNTGGED